jgi:hypothetical protein
MKGLPHNFSHVASTVDQEPPQHLDTGDQMKVKQVLDEAVARAVSGVMLVILRPPICTHCWLWFVRLLSVFCAPHANLAAEDHIALI